MQNEYLPIPLIRCYTHHHKRHGVHMLTIGLISLFTAVIMTQQTYKLDKWPEVWSEYVCKRVELEGLAVNSKLGAAVYNGEELVWIDGLESWPEGYYLGEKKGKKVRVTGTVTFKDYGPVIDNLTPNDEQRAGILGEEHEVRIVLKDVEWKLLE